MQIQGQKIDKKHVELKYRGMIDAILKISKQEGFQALYAGYVIFWHYYFVHRQWSNIVLRYVTGLLAITAFICFIHTVISVGVFIQYVLTVSFQMTIFRVEEKKNSNVEIVV